MSFEKLGFIPRSLYRTTIRFGQQLVNSSNLLVLEEFRFSRYQTIVSLKCVVNLIILPFFLNFIIFHIIYVLYPQTDSRKSIQILNLSQKQQHYFQLQNKKDQVFFDFLISKSPNLEIEASFYKTLIQKEKKKQQIKYSQTITNYCMLLFFWYLIIKSTPQLIILKSFCLELIANLSDPKKAFLLILSTDLLVGFHSSQIWKLSLELLLTFLNLQVSKDCILLIISFFPVFLDTIFKYWIFRFLNKISPSTVAIYHNMIE